MMGRLEGRERTIIEALNWASSFLEERTNAHEWLLAHECQIERSALLTKLHEPCPDDIFIAFQEKVRIHKRGVPIQHLIGTEQFYGRTFSVNEHVLIPRPETEELVQLLLEKITKHFRGGDTLLGCDIGTGSGVIAITLALEEQRLHMTATDISKRALAVAKKNASRYQVDVHFLHGHLLEPLKEQGQRYHLIVSNPPYIETASIKELPPTVRDYEPHTALDGGVDGYDMYRHMIAQLPDVVQEQALIGFEVGAGQSDTVATLLRKQFPSATIETTDDINGKDRMVTALLGISCKD